jgi:hypothetical protein
MPTLASSPGRSLQPTRTGCLSGFDSFCEVGRLRARQNDQRADLAAELGKFTLERRKRLLGFTAM